MGSTPLGGCIGYFLKFLFSNFRSHIKDSKWGRKYIFMNYTCCNGSPQKIAFQFANGKLPRSRCRAFWAMSDIFGHLTWTKSCVLSHSVMIALGTCFINSLLWNGGKRLSTVDGSILKNIFDLENMKKETTIHGTLISECLSNLVN